MTKVTIDRELLEQVASEFEHDNDRYMLGRELRKILDAPQLPECEEPVAWMNPYGGVLQKRITGLERETFTIPLYTAPRQPEGDYGWLVNLELPEVQCNCPWNPDSHDPSCPVYLRDRLSDTQRAIAELREECERLRMQLAACGVVALANTPESAGEARQMHPDYMSASCSDVAGAVDREMTLRQQIAERDAEIMEQCRLNGIGAERELKLLTQRDKLAELLYEASGELRTDRHHGLGPRIDAALDEVGK